MDSGEDGDGMSEETIGKQLAEKIWELAMKKEHPELMKGYKPKPNWDKWVMNGEPLSTEQLHELIVSQSMTIDTALTRNGELVDALKRAQKLLQEGKFYEAWNEINKVLGIV